MDEQEDKATKHKNELHYHTRSEEWYFTFRGEQQLVINKKKVKVPEGHLLRIGSKVPHNIATRTYPFEGMTMRAPLIIEGDKVVIDDE